MERMEQMKSFLLQNRGWDRLRSLAPFASVLVLMGCSGGEKKRQVQVSVSGWDSAAQSSVVQGAAVQHSAWAALLQAAALEPWAPPGHSTVFPVVEGFKIRLTGIEAIGDGHGGPLFNWSAAPRELQVADGFSGAIEDEGTLANGTYNALRVGLEPNFSIKAWAHFDADGDGTIERTVWTTAAGVVSSDGLVTSPAQMAGYDYYRYPFLYRSMANSATADTSKAAEASHFPSPLVITDAPTYVDGEGNEVPAPDSYRIDVRLDTHQVAMAWDGFGPRGDLFGQGNHHNIPATAFFPDGQPAIALNYLPMMAFLNQPDAVAETYQVASSPDFTVETTQLLTLFVDSSQQILASRTRHRAGLDLNQFGRLFTAAGDGSYSFAVGDGDLLYTGNPSHTQHQVTGFRRLTETDAPVELTITDGPACSTSAIGCPGTRTGYLRRLASP